MVGALVWRLALSPSGHAHRSGCTHAAVPRCVHAQQRPVSAQATPWGWATPWARAVHPGGARDEL